MTIQAIEHPIFQPAMRIITAITQAIIPTVTTSFAHDYITGTIVRLYVPKSYGMFEINQMQSEITVTSPTTFTVNIDTRGYDPFVVPGSFKRQYAQVVAIGENNSILLAAERNIL